MSSFKRALRALVWRAGWPARAVLLASLLGYRRLFGGAFAGRCRFHPSCSGYAQDAIRLHGAVKGSLLSMWRVLRCSPLSDGGPDPIPERGRWSSKRMTTSYQAEGGSRVG